MKVKIIFWICKDFSIFFVIKPSKNWQKIKKKWLHKNSKMLKSYLSAFLKPWGVKARRQLRENIADRALKPSSPLFAELMQTLTVKLLYSLSQEAYGSSQLLSTIEYIAQSRPKKKFCVFQWYYISQIFFFSIFHFLPT